MAPYLRALGQLTELLLACEDADSKIDSFFDLVTECADAQFARLVLVGTRPDRPLRVVYRNRGAREEPSADAMDLNRFETALVLRSGRPKTVFTDARSAGAAEYGSFITLPFLGSEYAVGALTIAWIEPRQVSAEDLSFVEAAAFSLALGLDNVGLQQRLVMELQHTVFVRDVASVAAETLDPTQVATDFLRIAALRIGASWGAVYETIGDIGHLLASTTATSSEPVEFSQSIAMSLVRDELDGQGDRTGRLPSSMPPCGIVVQSAAPGSPWVFHVLERLSGCLGVVVLGFKSERGLPSGAVLDDAFERLEAALENARLYAEQALAARLGRVLDEVDAQMHSATTVHEIHRAAEACLIESLGASTVNFTLADEAEAGLAKPAPHVSNDLRRFELGYRVFDSVGKVTVHFAEDVPPPFGPAEADFMRRLTSAMSLALENMSVQAGRDELIKAREDWLADFSHDIRTPLATIRGYAELLSTGVDIEEAEIHRESRLIARQSTVIEHLIQDLQLAFRLRYKQLPLTISSVDLVPLVADALESAVWGSGGLPSLVLLDCPDMPVYALLDQNHYPRIIANLVTNALVHNPDGTEVRIGIGLDDIGACVTVSDDGVGMAPDLVDRVFMRGERGGSPHDRRPGSGLGLPIARQLAEAMGGALSLESEEGRGTTVTVSMPAAASTEARSA